MQIFKCAVLAIVLLVGFDVRAQVKRYDDYPEYESDHFEDRPEGLWRALAADKGLRAVIVERLDSVKGDTQKVYKYETIGKSLREEYVRYGNKYLRDSVILEFDSLGHIVRRESHDFLRPSINLYQYANGFLTKKYIYYPERNDLKFTSYYLGPNGHFRRIVEHDDNANGFEFTMRFYDHNNLSHEREWTSGQEDEKNRRYKYDSLGRMTEMIIEQYPVDSNRRYSLSYFNRRLTFRDSGHTEYKAEYRYNVATGRWDSLPSYLTVTDSLHHSTVRSFLDSTDKPVWIDSTFKDSRRQPIKSVRWTFYNRADRSVTKWEYGDHGEILSEKKKYASGRTSSTVYHYEWQ